MVGTKNDAGYFTELTFERTFSASTTILSAITSLITGSTTNIPSQYGYSDPNNHTPTVY